MNSGILPDDVQDDVFEVRIAVVTVRPPVAGPQVNLHVAGARRIVADLNDRAAEIRPAFDTGETGVQNADGPAVRGFELVAPQTLVPPDGLEQTLVRRIMPVAQQARGAQTRAPGGVKMFRGRRQLELLLRRRLRKVKPALKILNASNGGFDC